MFQRIFAAYFPQKKEQIRLHLTVDEDQINYPFDTSMPTADLMTTKMLWNSVMLTKNAKFITPYIADFHLGTLM